MRSPLFHSAVALVAASLTGVAFAEGDASAAQNRTNGAQANQPAEVQVDTSMDRNGNQAVEPRHDDPITASGEIGAERDPSADLHQADLGDGAIQAGAELEGDAQPDRVDLDAQGDVNIETQGDVNIKTERDSLNTDRSLDRSDEAIGASGEIRTDDQSGTTGNQSDRDGVGGSVELGDPDRSSDHDLHMQRDRDATGAQGEVHLRDQDRAIHRDGSFQRDQGAIGASGEVQTQQDRTYRTEQYRTQDRDTNGFGVRGEVEVGDEAQTAGSVQGGDRDQAHDRSSGSDDWKWNAEEPHLQNKNPDKPHLSD